MKLCTAALAAIATALIAAACGGGSLESDVSQELSAAGGSVVLDEGASIYVPPGAISEAASVTISRGSDENPPPEGLEAAESLGEPFRIEIEGQDDLASPVTVEIPYDPESLPDGAAESTIFLAYFDEEANEWIPVSGVVDTERNVIAVQTSHLSWWQVWTWNWGAWIAVLNNLLTLNLTDWFDAVALLTAECSQGGQTVTVDASKANNVIQGCVERDDASQPELRVVNPKSFFFEVSPVSGGNGYPPQEILGPGESLRFDANTSDSPPLIISAEINQRAGLYLVTHLIIQMLPGLNQLGIQGSQIACITERIADVAQIAAAVESLIGQQDGAAAAEDLANFLLDDAAVLRFITASDDCFYGAAATWSPEGIRQIGAATATIISATDFVANYFLNYRSEVAFNWVQPTPTPPPTPERPRSSGELRAALISLEDLPVGWSELPGAGDDSDVGPDACGLNSLDPQPRASAEANFRRASTGPFLLHAVEAYASGQAAVLFDVLRMAYESCRSPIDIQDGFDQITLTISPLSFPQLGDETIAVRVLFESYLTPFEADLVAIRRGDLVSAVVNLSPESFLPSQQVDSALTLFLAQLADRKLEALLR